MSDPTGFFTIENAKNMAESVRSGKLALTADNVQAIISSASSHIDQRDHQIKQMTAIIEQLRRT